MLAVGLVGHCLCALALAPGEALQTGACSPAFACLPRAACCSLEQFCGRDIDEESSLIGGPTLLKFVSTFREARTASLERHAWPPCLAGLAPAQRQSLPNSRTLAHLAPACALCLQLASFQDLLRTQTEVVLCERLSHDFSKVTSEVKESKRRLDKRSSEYDAARLKHTHTTALAGR